MPIKHRHINSLLPSRLINWRVENREFMSKGFSFEIKKSRAENRDDSMLTKKHAFILSKSDMYPLAIDPKNTPRMPEARIDDEDLNRSFFGKKLE